MLLSAEVALQPKCSLMELKRVVITLMLPTMEPRNQLELALLITLVQYSLVMSMSSVFLLMLVILVHSLHLQASSKVIQIPNYFFTLMVQKVKLMLMIGLVLKDLLRVKNSTMMQSLQPLELQAHLLDLLQRVKDIMMLQIFFFPTKTLLQKKLFTY